MGKREWILSGVGGVLALAVVIWVYLGPVDTPLDINKDEPVASTGALEEDSGPPDFLARCVTEWNASVNRFSHDSAAALIASASTSPVAGWVEPDCDVSVIAGEPLGDGVHFTYDPGRRPPQAELAYGYYGGNEPITKPPSDAIAVEVTPSGTLAP